MPHPKRKRSKTRRDKTRTHYKLSMPALTVCPTTGTSHLRHHAFWQNGKLYYKGKVLADKAPVTA